MSSLTAQESHASNKTSDVQIRASGHGQPDLIIRSDHSDEVRYLHHILKELQDANLNKPKGEVWGFQFLLSKDAPPVHIDFLERQNSQNLPKPIKIPNCPLTSIRLYNMGDGTFVGTGIVFYSLNISAIEGGTCILPVTTASHKYYQKQPTYYSLNLRATGADCIVGATLEI